MNRSASLIAFLMCACLVQGQWRGHAPGITVSPLFGTAHPVYTGERGGGPPYNDQCQGAIVTAVPQDGSISVSGTNIGATDTETFGNPNVWEAFSIDTCSTITVGYCGTAPVHTLVYSILIVGCPDGEVSIQNSGTSTCVDGNTTITYANLPAGTYYVPVLLFPGEAEGPYTITFTSEVCDLPPANETCASAITIPVVADCAQGGVINGNNSNAVQNGADPSCSPSATQVQDVWYTFDSGTQEEVVITLGTGTTGDLGVQILSACGGTSVFCGTGDSEYTVPVTPGTTYKLRMFSNNDLGFGGAFTFCIHTPGSPVVCEGGEVSFAGGATDLVVCTSGAEQLVLEQSTAGTANASLLLTTGTDTVITVLVDGILNTAGLTPGTYHVWGLSYDGSLVNADAGTALVDLVASGSCLDISAAPASLTVEVCQGEMERPIEKPAFEVRVEEGSVMLYWHEEGRTIAVDVIASDGKALQHSDVRMENSARRSLAATVGWPPGIYAVRGCADGRCHTARFLVH